MTVGYMAKSKAFRNRCINSAQQLVRDETHGGAVPGTCKIPK